MGTTRQTRPHQTVFGNVKDMFLAEVYDHVPLPAR